MHPVDDDKWQKIEHCILTIFIEIFRKNIF
jgi:hypothetical protein